jgi:hypothetical protein
MTQIDLDVAESLLYLRMRTWCEAKPYGEVMIGSRYRQPLIGNIEGYKRVIVRQKADVTWLRESVRLAKRSIVLQI